MRHVKRHAAQRPKDRVRGREEPVELEVQSNEQRDRQRRDAKPGYVQRRETDGARRDTRQRRTHALIPAQIEIVGNGPFTQDQFRPWNGSCEHVAPDHLVERPSLAMLHLDARIER